MKHLWIPAAVLIFSACGGSKTVRSDLLADQLVTSPQGEVTQQSPIYRNYSVTVDEASDQTQFFATFSAGGPRGATVKLVAPSEVRFEDTTAVEASVSEEAATLLGMFLSPVFLLASGTSYHADIPNNDASTYAISWTDPKGRPVEDEVTITPLKVSLTQTELHLSKGISLTLPDKNQLILEKARLELQIQQSDTTVAHAYVSESMLQSLEGNTLHLNLTVSKANPPKPGPAVVRVSKVSAVPLNANQGMGGVAYLRYVKSFDDIDIDLDL